MKQRVLEILKERDMSVKDFCILAGLTKNAVYDLGYNYPTLTNALKIANTLKVSLDYLIGNTDEEEVVIKDNQNFCFYEQLTKMLEQTGIAKRKVCRDIGLSKDAFTRWKRGAEPNFSTVINLAEYLGYSIDEFLGRN